MKSYLEAILDLIVLFLFGERTQAGEPINLEKGRSKASVKRCKCALLVSIPIGKHRHWYCPTEVLNAVSGREASSSDSCQKLVRWSRPLKIMFL